MHHNACWTPVQRLRKQGTNHLWVIEIDGVALISAHVWVLRVLGSAKTGGLSEVTFKQRIAILSTILYDKQWWLSKLSIKVKVSLWWTENNTKNSPNFICAVMCLVTSAVSDYSQPHGLLCLWLLSQAPLSMGFSRQEYWSGLPFPSPGDLPNPGIEPRSGRFFTV